MIRVIEPPRQEHADLRQPMTPGEQRLLDLFDDSLDPNWEIYVQPHLNGLRPDFVLLNPMVGACVIEVKDWNLSAMHYFVKEHRSGERELYADDGKHAFAVENPFTKIRRYKDALYNIYCPRLQNKYGYAAIVGSVVFPFSERSRVQQLQEPFLKSSDKGENVAEYWPIGGRDDINAESLPVILPILGRKKHSLMTPALADDLRGWLVEPDFSKTQRMPLELDANQWSLANSRTPSGYRRIKGPAGSGKSLVLAARAAKLASEDKSVLIVTFNMTLWHYLKDLISRAAVKKGWSKQITFVHFHEWCKNVCLEANLLNEYAEVMGPVSAILKLKLEPKEEARRLRPLMPPIMDNALPALAKLAASSAETLKYDAVFVDEGQDFLPHWWSALREICVEKGEMILVADATQDVYGTAKSWTEDAMIGAGFPGGRWAELSVGYRMPHNAALMARDYAIRFLPSATRDIPEPVQKDFDLEPCDLHWIQCSDADAMRHCVNAVLAMMRQTGRAAGTANADITFLTNDIFVGRQVVDELETYSVKAVHTFDQTKEIQSRKKMSFYMGDARLKATTFHSFKGWETRLLVLHVKHALDSESKAAIYAALTRLKRSPVGSSLTVICSAPELAEFGASWTS